jgi:hypothetical protein
MVKAVLETTQHPMCAKIQQKSFNESVRTLLQLLKAVLSRGHVCQVQINGQKHLLIFSSETGTTK